MRGAGERGRTDREEIGDGVGGGRCWGGEVTTGWQGE